MERTNRLQEITTGYRVSPMVALLGPRQCGKTTLARQYAKTHAVTHIFDLENPEDLQQLQNPMLALEKLEGLIIIDEVQLAPDLFKILRVLIDRENNKQRYLILGSASRDLISQSSETLAGRIYHIELTPFSYKEVDDLQALHLRGGFPLSLLADNEEISYQWRQQYINTFLERDIPNLGFNVSASTMRRFWLMLCHNHGNIFNASNLARSLGSNHTTIRQYLNILDGTLMVRSLNPWYENLQKRQVKSPKIYFRDSGILHALIGANSSKDLNSNPQLGASWEGFALEQVTQKLNAKQEECFFWATHASAELDLLIIKDGERLGFEFKYSDAPSSTRSMHIAIDDLKLDSLTVIYPGKKSYRLKEKIDVIGLETFLL